MKIMVPFVPTPQRSNAMKVTIHDAVVSEVMSELSADYMPGVRVYEATLTRENALEVSRRVTASDKSEKSIMEILSELMTLEVA